MASLPLDIIDKIFLANPNKIISTYLAFVKKSETSDKKAVNTENNKKRRKLINTSNEDITKNQLDKPEITKYLLNKETYLRYYKQSSWFKYFIQLLNSQSRRTTQTTKVINERIELIATYFQQLDKNINTSSTMAYSTIAAAQAITTEKDDDYKDNKDDTLKSITQLETILDAGGFSTDKYSQQLESLMKYYQFKNISEIPVYIRLVVMLYNCGYFASSSDSGGGGSGGSISTKPKIHIFLDMILEGDSTKILDFTTTYRYYTAYKKFIPLFGIYLGMGYSFVLGWDTEFNGIIGLTENGSDWHEIMYNTHRAMSYFRQPRRIVKVDKMRLQEDYLKMLGAKDTAILLDYSRRLDICDMPSSGSSF